VTPPVNSPIEWFRYIVYSAIMRFEDAALLMRLLIYHRPLIISNRIDIILT